MGGVYLFFQNSTVKQIKIYKISTLCKQKQEKAYFERNTDQGTELQKTKISTLTGTIPCTSLPLKVLNF